MILALRILTDRKSRHLAPVSRSLTTSFAETRALSQREGRKPQAQASLATRSTDATRFDNPTAGSSFFLALAVTAPALDTRTPSRPRSRPHALRRLATCTCRHRCLRLSSLGDETTVPRFPTSALVFRRLRCGAGSDTSFPPPFLAGTAGCPSLGRKYRIEISHYVQSWYSPQKQSTS